MMATKLYEDLISGSATPQKAPITDSEDVERRLARARGKARAEGFAEGVASAEASFDREMQTQIKAIGEALSQFTAEREAADAASVDTLRRILSGTIAAFAPTLADATLPELVAGKVADAVRVETDGHVLIDVASEHLSDLTAALDLRDDRIRLNEDQHLCRGTARVTWRGGFDHIDASAAIRAGAQLLDERLRVRGARNDGTTSAKNATGIHPSPQPISARPTESGEEGTAIAAKDNTP